MLSRHPCRVKGERRAVSAKEKVGVGIRLRGERIQLCRQLLQHERPIGAEAANHLPIGVKEGVVHLLAAGVHGRDDHTPAAGQQKRHPLQRTDGGAGLPRGPRHPLEGGHPDPHTGKGAGACRPPQSRLSPPFRGGRPTGRFAPSAAASPNG